jgi:tetratricopeptide (TPR) repeat protein
MKTRGHFVRWLCILLLPVLAFAAYTGGREFLRRRLLHTAEQAQAQRDFRRAGAHLQAYLKHWPDDTEAILLAAQTARRRGDFAEADKLLSRHAAKKGPRPPNLLEQDLLRLHQGDLHDANTVLAYARDHPDESATPLMLEAAFEGMLNSLLPPFAADRAVVKQFDDGTMAALARAVDDWLRQRTSPTDQAQGLVWRGRLRRIQDDPDGALADFRRALALDEGNFQARLQLALLLLYEAPEETERHLRRLRQQHPDELRLLLPYAAVGRILGRLNEAQQMLDDYLAAHPHDVAALLERGNLALDQQDYDAAVRWLRQAQGLAPNEPRTNFGLARCLRLTGQATEAQTYQERFERLQTEQMRRRQSKKAAPAPGAASNLGHE